MIFFCALRRKTWHIACSRFMPSQPDNQQIPNKFFHRSTKLQPNHQKSESKGEGEGEGEGEGKEVEGESEGEDLKQSTHNHTRSYFLRNI